MCVGKWLCLTTSRLSQKVPRIDQRTIIDRSYRFLPASYRLRWLYTLVCLITSERYRSVQNWVVFSNFLRDHRLRWQWVDSSANKDRFSAVQHILAGTTVWIAWTSSVVLLGRSTSHWSNKLLGRLAGGWRWNDKLWKTSKAAVVWHRVQEPVDMNFWSGSTRSNRFRCCGEIEIGQLTSFPGASDSPKWNPLLCHRGKNALQEVQNVIFQETMPSV